MFTNFLSSVSLLQLFTLLASSPLLIITILLALIVVFINGWTDAPNSVATCISTRALSPKKAIVMAAFCNLLGVIIFALFAAGVAESIAGIIDFGGVDDNSLESINNAHTALIGLSSGMVATALWGFIAWCFGIPSSESHALVAGLTGSAFALMMMNIDATPSGSSWSSVGIGFLISSLIGLFLGFFFTKFIELVCQNISISKSRSFFKYSQIGASALMALAHGAQDGLKFVGIIYMALYLGVRANPDIITANLSSPFMEGFQMDFLSDPSFLWLPILVALVMGIGTSIGGYRIIKKVGMGMVNLKPYQGFATDLSAFCSLLLSTFLGWPVSTSQVKTCSIIGVGLTKGVKSVKWKIALDMVLTWVFTFPGCILIGIAVTYIFFAIPGI